MDFYEFVVDTYEDMNYIEVMRCYSGHFERMTRGNYQRWEQGQRGLRPSQAKLHENSTNTTPDCCPACGSVDIVKSGKPLQIHSVGRVRTAEEVRLRSTILWLLRQQNSVTEDGRRKGAILGVQGACPFALGEWGLSADSRGKAPLDLFGA